MTLVGTLALLVSAASLALSSVWLVSLARPRNSAETLMGAFLVGWAQVNVVIQVLSFLHAIGPWSLMAAHGAALILSAALRGWTSAPPAPLSLRREGVEVWRSWRMPLLFKALIALWSAMILITTLYLLLMTPQNIGDALAYHLSRAAHWLQNQSIAHYRTELVRQNEMPLSGEIGILWTMVFVRGDVLAGLPAWLCWGPLALACHGILRGLPVPPTACVLAVCTLASLPQVIYLSSSAENDLLAGTLLCVGLYFLAGAFASSDGVRGRLILAALGIGLALATKGTTLLWAPGVLVLLVGAALRAPPGGRIRRIGSFCGWTAASAALFAGYGWLENWRWFGSPFLSPQEAERQRVIDPDCATWASNSLKNVGWFCEPMRVGEALFGAGRLQQWTMRALERTHAGLGVDLSSPRTNFGHGDSPAYVIPSTPRSWWMAHLGPLGFLLFWPAFAVTGLAGLVRCCRPDRRGSPTLGCALWVLAGLAHFAIANIYLTWRPGGGRIWVPLMCVALPGVAWLYVQLGRSVAARWLAALAVGGVALGASLEAAFQNPRAPLVATAAERSVFGRSRASLRTDLLTTRPEHFPSLAVECFVPADAVIGLALDERGMDFPMFGPALTRRCIPVDRSEIDPADPAAVLRKRKFDALLAVGSTFPGQRNLIISRWTLPDGLTLFRWADGFLVLRAPLPDSRFPGKIRYK